MGGSPISHMSKLTSRGFKKFSQEGLLKLPISACHLTSLPGWFRDILPGPKVTFTENASALSESSSRHDGYR